MTEYEQKVADYLEAMKETAIAFKAGHSKELIEIYFQKAWIAIDLAHQINKEDRRPLRDFLNKETA